MFWPAESVLMASILLYTSKRNYVLGAGCMAASVSAAKPCRLILTEQRQAIAHPGKYVTQPENDPLIEQTTALAL